MSSEKSDGGYSAVGTMTFNERAPKHLVGKKSPYRITVGESSATIVIEIPLDALEVLRRKAAERLGFPLEKVTPAIAAELFNGYGMNVVMER